MIVLIIVLSVEYDGELQRNLNVDKWFDLDLRPDIPKLGGKDWSLERSVALFTQDARKYGIKLDERYYGTSGPQQRTIPSSLHAATLPWINAFKEELDVE
ncbi:hypothetical protein C0989_001336 [Termitomyces sp. Mn162]|nr:hypothetical protein C0989_001336 [Termitomyces sp. Mn162]